MKKIYISLLLIFIAGSFTAGAQGFWDRFPKINIGIHTGMDIGAAAPYPPSSLGSGSKINAVPYLTPSLGISGFVGIDDRWSLSLETTYKSFGIEANAWVTDQKFKDPDDPGSKVNFRGTADIKMRFSMLEVPLLVGYSFGKQRQNRILLGPYYAYVFQHRFSASPKKGLVTNPNKPGSYTIVSPENPYDQQEFDQDMSAWDIGAVIGCEWRVIERVHFGVRLEVGAKDIFKRGQSGLDYKMIHMRGTVVIGYKIFNIR